MLVSLNYAYCYNSISRARSEDFNRSIFCNLQYDTQGYMLTCFCNKDFESVSEDESLKLIIIHLSSV